MIFESMTSSPYTIPLTEPPDIEDLVTDDGEPVDNIFSEKQQRLLTESLYTSWNCPKFLALANVGLFYDVKQSPLVPDVLVSMDVQIAQDLSKKSNQSYFVWKHGKLPEIVIEIVSNKKGREAESKLTDYAYIGISYYAIFDPNRLISNNVLRLYELHHGTYIQKADKYLPKLGLHLKLWQGVYETLDAQWLRWYDGDNQLILTGQESTKLQEGRAYQEYLRAEQEWQRAEQQQQRAESERQRAEQQQQRAEQEQSRADKLAAQLRALGIDPETL